jgi:hypothetical protein
MALPLFTRPEDIRSIAEYLITKPTGATLKEIKAALGTKIIDGRKIAAFQTLNVIISEGDRIKLTSDVGRKVGRASDDEFSQILLLQLADIPAYRGVLEWAYHNKLTDLSVSEVGAHWHDNFRQELGTDNDMVISNKVVCFLQLSDGSGLGQFIMGRRGQPSRLVIAQEVLRNFVKGESVVTSAAEPESPTDETPLQEEIPSKELSTKKLSVFISHSKNKNIVEQIKTMLDLAGLESRIAKEEETTAIPVPDKVLLTMRECTSAIICVTADENEKRDDDRYGINQNVLIEIGSAFVLYNKKVVLVWDKRIDVPSNLQGLYRCEFSGNELSWSEGMRLMKVLTQFKT